MAARKAATRVRERAFEGVPIRIAKNLELDQRPATQKLGIMERSESGKTYSSETRQRTHEIGSQLTVLDPIGNGWGLTPDACHFGGRRMRAACGR